MVLSFRLNHTQSAASNGVGKVTWLYVHEAVFSMASFSNHKHSEKSAYCHLNDRLMTVANNDCNQRI